MRGDRVGVGDICSWPGRAWSTRVATSVDDCWPETYEHFHCIVNRSQYAELVAIHERGRNRIGVGDGAWFSSGACGLLSEGIARRYRVRIDRVGVGIGIAVSYGARY